MRNRQSYSLTLESGVEDNGFGKVDLEKLTIVSIYEDAP